MTVDPGQYRYSVWEDGGNFGQATMTFAAPTAGGRQEVDFRVPEDEPLHRSWVTQRTAAGLFEVETVHEINDYRVRCVWAEPVLLQPAVMGVGDSWRTNTSCDIEIDGRQGHKELVQDAEVLAVEDREAGGTMRHTFRIRRSGSIVQTGAESGRTEYDDVVNVTETGLMVVSVRTSRASVPGSNVALRPNQRELRLEAVDLS